MSTIDPARTALLVMDFQAEILANFPDGAAAVVARAADLIAAARAAAVPVVYVVVGFRPGYPELAPGSPMHKRLGGSGRLVSTTPGADIAPALAPAAGDVIVRKHRISAFHGTELDLVLRAGRRDTLILCGVATSGVILSTVRHGADADYRLIVVEDACHDADPEVHRLLMTRVLSRQATVAPAAEVVADLASARAGA